MKLWTYHGCMYVTKTQLPKEIDELFETKQ